MFVFIIIKHSTYRTNTVPCYTLNTLINHHHNKHYFGFILNHLKVALIYYLYQLITYQISNDVYHTSWLGTH